LTNVGLYDDLAAHILSKTEIKVWYVIKQVLEKDQHDDHVGCPVSLDGNLLVIPIT
jgi:hypothetical protein